MIAVSENLLREYIKYKKTNNEYDKDLIQKFFKYYQPFVISAKQLINIGYNRKTAFTLLQDKKIFATLSSRILAVTNEEDLIKHSKLKLMIRDDDTKFDNYTSININQNEIEPRFSSTYKKDDDRKEAKKHIRSLLFSNDVNKIEIYDKYLFSKHNETTNINLLKELLPENKKIKVYIGTYGNLTQQSNRNQNAINVLKAYNLNFDIESLEIDENIHDRYIICNNVEIILSSGFYYLENKEKDLTYIVRVKN